MTSRLHLLLIISLVAALLTACGSTPAPIGSEPAPAAAAAQSAATDISATGEVVPARWTTLSFPAAGTLIDLQVDEGDTVKAGDVIAQLDAIDLRAQLAQKQAALQTAQAQLAQLQAAPRPDELAAAQQAIAAAEARAAAATAQRDRLYSTVTAADITQAETQVYAAQQQTDKLSDAMDRILNKGGFALAAGEPVGNYLKYAELQQAAAQAYLDELQRGPTPNQVAVANAQIWAATAQVKAAQARYTALQNGPLAEDVASAQAKIDQAQAEADVLSAQLAQLQLVAPFDATIARVLADTDQFVGPGQPIVQLADLSQLQIETTDLTEKDAARVQLGDRARVRIDALPDVALSGVVTRLAPKAKDGTGVNFTATLEVSDLPEAVRWGMTASAEIEAAPAAAVEPARAAAISANGKVVPAQKTVLSFALPGTAVEVLVDTGTAVKRGAVLARLDTALLDAEVAKAEAGVKVAQANRDRVAAGPRPEVVAEANSILEASEARVKQATAFRNQVVDGPTDAQIAAAQAAVQEAYINMVDVRTRRDLLVQDKDNGQATRAMVDDAEQAFVIAERDYRAAQERLSKLQAGAEAAVVRAAQADLSAATAEFKAQQAQVNVLLAGARPEDLAVADAGVAQAQAGLERARATRAQAEIVAPFDGVIAERLIQPGQFVNAGTPIVLAADLGRLQVETSDLNEKDIAHVAVGDQVTVTFDALPGVSVPGTIVQIAPKSNKSAGVNYAVTIELADNPAALRWGMTALVNFQ